MQHHDKGHGDLTNTTTPLRTLAESLQWMTFSLSFAIGTPLVTGAVLGLDQASAISLAQNALIMVGLSSVLQLAIGHRMVLTMVPALLWVTVVISLSRFDAGNGAVTRLITDVQGGFLVTALVLVLLAVVGAARLLLRLFTPAAVSVFLLMLVVQAGGPFFSDALGIGEHGTGIDLAAAGASVLLILLFLAFSSPNRQPVWRALALPLAIGAGGLALWLLRALGVGAAEVAAAAGAASGAGRAALFSLPLFPWGLPTFNWAVILAIVPCVLPVLASTSSGVTAGSQVHNRSVDAATLGRAVLVTGIGTAWAGTGGLVAPVTQSESAGFITMTGMRRPLSFVIGMCLLIVVGLSPALVGVLATIPTSLFAAALLAAFSPMAGIAVRTLTSGPLTQRERTIFGIGLLFGIGAVFLPPDALSALPETVRYLLTNGMVVGVAVALLLEHVFFRRPWRDED